MYLNANKKVEIRMKDSLTIQILVPQSAKFSIGYDWNRLNSCFVIELRE